MVTSTFFYRLAYHSVQSKWIKGPLLQGAVTAVFLGPSLIILRRVVTSSTLWSIYQKQLQIIFRGQFNQFVPQGFGQHCEFGPQSAEASKHLM